MVRNRRLRTVDVLHAMLLPVICYTVAFAIKEHHGAIWMKPSTIAGQPAPSNNAPQPRLASRIAPASPLTGDHVAVRLTHIEDLSDESLIARPASLSREIRVADEEASIEAPAEAKATEPALRAALNLGDQPMRSLHH
jgi:hypothetical protein